MESAVPSKCYDNIFKEQIHLKEMHSSRQQIHETNLFFLTLSTALSEDGWTRPVVQHFMAPKVSHYYLIYKHITIASRGDVLPITGILNVFFIIKCLSNTKVKGILN